MHKEKIIEPTHIAFLVIAGVMISVSIWQTRLQWDLLRMLPFEEDLPERERRFLHRQHRRRLQLSVLIGLAGLCILIGSYIPTTQGSWFVLVWSCAILFILWTILISAVDLLSIYLHFGQKRRKNIASQARRRYELLLEARRREKEAREASEADADQDDDSGENPREEGS